MSGFDSKLDIKYKSKLFKPASSISFGQSGNPVIQIKNDQFCKPAKSTSLKVDNYYEEEEEEEYYVPQVKKPHTYLVEKTLTVKKPQLLPISVLEPAMPKRQPQVVKKTTLIATKKPSPIQYESSDNDVIDETHRELKRKAASVSSSGPLKLAKASGFVSGVPALSLDGPKVFKPATAVSSEDLSSEAQVWHN